MRFLDILVVFRLDLGKINFNLAKTAFATRQLAFLVTGIAFYDISTRAYAEIYVFRLFDFWIFFALPFSPFSPFLLFLLQ